MQSAIREGFEKYADFSGTTSRANYWWWSLFTTIAIMVAGVIDVLFGTTFIANIVTIVLIIPSISVTTRRMHDVGRSGWMQLIPFYNLYLALKPSKA